MKTSSTLVQNIYLIAGLIAASAMTAQHAHAQTYTAVELVPDSTVSLANTIFSGMPAGSSVYEVPLVPQRAHATLWSDSGRVDLHPSLLNDTLNGIYGSSNVLGTTDNLQVGWGYGPTLQNRYAPMAWNGNPDSARILEIPFTNAGGQALATDGNQIVGYGTGLNNDGTTIGPTHAMVWDVKSMSPVDLGDAGNGAQALGVGGYQQVGYVIKGTQNAALWTGTRNSLVLLHPKNAIASSASGTDGTYQVGFSNYSVRVRVEAVKGNKDKIYSYATVWRGSAESAWNIHPYPFTHSYAKAINGQWIVGYATEEFSAGVPSVNHAIVWDSTYQATDLNTFLENKFISAQALAVDDQGNIAGVAFTADGLRHAVMWKLNPTE